MCRPDFSGILEAQEQQIHCAALCDVLAGRGNSLVDNRKAAGVAVDGAALCNAHAREASCNIAGLDGGLAVQCQRAVAIAGAIQGTLQSTHAHVSPRHWPFVEKWLPAPSCAVINFESVAR